MKWAAVSAWLVMIPSLVAAAEPLSLFNGKNLEGWWQDTISTEVPPGGLWHVTDGMLVCEGRPPGVLRTNREFSNYELLVEWRWAPGKKPGNSGLLVHCSKPREMFVWPKSIEVQLRAGDAGDFWMIGEQLVVSGAEAQGRRWVKKGANPEKPPGEWNTMRVRCSADKVTVTINDTLVNEGAGLSATKGAICLQSEGAEIHFRKVELTALE